MPLPTETAADFYPDREIVSSRVFEAPMADVFSAWTNPEILARWWGPKGFTKTFREFNPTPGGEWRSRFMGPAEEP